MAELARSASSFLRRSFCMLHGVLFGGFCTARCLAAFAHPIRSGCMQAWLCLHVTPLLFCVVVCACSTARCLAAFAHPIRSACMQEWLCLLVALFFSASWFVHAPRPVVWRPFRACSRQFFHIKSARCGPFSRQCFEIKSARAPLVFCVVVCACSTAHCLAAFAHPISSVCMQAWLWLHVTPCLFCVIVCACEGCARCLAAFAHPISSVCMQAWLCVLVTPFLFCVIVCACEGCALCLMGEKKKGVCEIIRGPPNNADIPDFLKKPIRRVFAPLHPREQC